MACYAMPVGEQFIVHRPLLRIAFRCNPAAWQHIQRRLDGKPPATGDVLDGLLDSAGFWKADPEPPPSWDPAAIYLPATAVLWMAAEDGQRRDGAAHRRRLPLALAKSAIDAVHENARASGRKSFAVVLHGEPSVNWRVLRGAVEYARSKPLPCEISLRSAGMGGDRQRRFLLKNCDSARISLDLGTGNFAAATRTMRRLDAAGFAYGICLTVPPSAFGGLARRVSALCSGTRCLVMEVEPRAARDRSRRGVLTADQAESFARAFLEAFEIAAGAGRTLYYPGARPWALVNAFCRASQDEMVVTPAGTVMACAAALEDGRRTPQAAIGSVTSRGVEVAADRLREFAALQARRRAACGECFCRWHCGGDCSSGCLDPPGPDSVRCRINQRITRDLLAWFIAASGGFWRGENMGLFLP